MAVSRERYPGLTIRYILEPQYEISHSIRELESRVHYIYNFNILLRQLNFGSGVLPCYNLGLLGEMNWEFIYVPVSLIFLISVHTGSGNEKYL